MQTSDDGGLCPELLNAPVLFGLRQQGKLDRVRQMVDEGETWEDIAAEIGWTADAVERMYGMENPTVVLKTDWSMGEAPKCKCGARARAFAVNDDGHFCLQWYCEDCDEQHGEIDWPFVDRWVWAGELEKLGFEVENA